MAMQRSFPATSDRNAGLEFFHVFTLFNANQWHLSIHFGFTMSGLLQIGSLFSIRKLFRARGLMFSGSQSFSTIRDALSSSDAWGFQTDIIILSMNKQTYALLKAVMVFLIILSGPQGVFREENGLHSSFGA
jgi:hypothetical protein